jgi:hypothetical protein
MNSSPLIFTHIIKAAYEIDSSDIDSDKYVICSPIFYGMFKAITLNRYDRPKSKKLAKAMQRKLIRGL